MLKIDARRISELTLIDTVGENVQIELLTGRQTSYVNLDNAATTPAAVEVVREVNALLEMYGSVQRGSGLKSVVSTAIYEGALHAIRAFAGADENDVVVVASNTTTAINRLAASFGFGPDDVVLISEIEHSSNELPWRSHANVEHIRCTSTGAFDLDELRSSLRRFGRRVRLVAMTAASNVSGYLPPIQESARIAHEYGAEIFVDCAQMVPHRRVQIRTSDAAADLDYIAFSGHKMYAPFGAGVVVGRKAPFLKKIPPDLTGGGTVDFVTPTSVVWANLPARLVPGTPNLIGIVALAAAARIVGGLLPERVRAHESALVEAALGNFASIHRVRLHAQDVFASPTEERLPLFPFVVEGYDHGLVAAVLAHEYGIAVRSGHLCQYEFMKRALGVTIQEHKWQEAEQQKGNKASMYGMVRASSALCTSVRDIEALGDALREFVATGPTLHYSQNKNTGHFEPKGMLRSWVSLVPTCLRPYIESSTQEGS
jgi:selenocysteine lyase/cysteine desulfurase